MFCSCWIDDTVALVLTLCYCLSPSFDYSRCTFSLFEINRILKEVRPSVPRSRDDGWLQ